MPPKRRADIHIMFGYNFMKVNLQTFQAMLMKSTTSEVILPEYIEVNDIKIECQREIKLLGICIDNKLKFNEHIEHICSKANVQLKIMYRFKKVLKQEDQTLCLPTLITAP